MLRGNDIYLRPVEPEDAELLYRWENSPELWKVSQTLKPYSLHVLKQFAASTQDIHEYKQVRFIICNNDDKAIGTIDFFEYDPEHARAGIGILIADKSERRKGYARQALELSHQYAFEHLLLNNLFCNIQSDNEASLSLFESLGYIAIGCKKNWNKTSKGWQDEWMYQKQKA